MKPTRCESPIFFDDTYVGFGGRCPATNQRRPCGKWHARLYPLFGLTVDEVAAQAPVGDLVPLEVLVNRRSVNAVYIVPAEDAEIWNALAADTYRDPEQLERDADEYADVGPVGPCQALVPKADPQAELDLWGAVDTASPQPGAVLAPALAPPMIPSPRISVPAPAIPEGGPCIHCGGPVPEVKWRLGIRNHLNCWKDQGR